MQQYALVAYDYTDDGALDRRLACREAHLEGIRELVRLGNFISGGAIVDDEGKMIGSNVHCQFDNRSELDAWLERDPYVTQKVWEHIEIRTVKLVDLGA
ncbi:YciI family protein [Halomonas huangheensis]|uniref:YCII-related domain-containing protein n=1 Tax=Halomonas huangheensis TaxID=1178482 RepID=W1N6V6_9GAMM|nr:YciI family protein [Halomonas huangheensis]ALM54327.1 hypothetical protein AR456_20175 [Halomonas huangheensis]ERL50886.1 hypothetical protein BJB45_20015 [Halomonas huangheensis]